MFNDGRYYKQVEKKKNGYSPLIGNPLKTQNIYFVMLQKT